MSLNGNFQDFASSYFSKQPWTSLSDYKLTNYYIFRSRKNNDGTKRKSSTMKQWTTEDNSGIRMATQPLEGTTSFLLP